MPAPASFKSSQRPTWCPGCGDFAVLGSLTKAVTNLGIKPHETMLVSGIGCSGKISQHFGAYGIHTLHGRVLPTATAVKVANRSLTVLAAGGDGDGFGIGVGHFVHAARRNVNITYIVMDNHIYALTTGQTSPTSDCGMSTKTHPDGAFEQKVHPVELAIISGATFVAQGFSGDPAELTEVLQEAILHPGFSLVNVFSPCVTFNKINTYETFKAQLGSAGEIIGYDPSDRMMALKAIREYGDQLTGVLYKEIRPTYEELLPNLTESPLTQVDLHISENLFNKMTEEFR